MEKVILYTKDKCSQCKMIKLMLDKKGIEYREIDDENLIRAIAEQNNILSMPFADIDGQIKDVQQIRDYMKVR